MLAQSLDMLRETITIYLAAGIALSGASLWAVVKAVRIPRDDR
jgi:hypothetical protein